MNEVVARLRAGSRFLFVLHVRPDGDSIGSSVALARALRQLGKETVVVRADAIPASLSFLCEAHETLAVADVAGEFDAAVFLDCAGLDRIGAAASVLDRCREIINVDHHASNGGFGQINYIDPEASAVGEITAALIAALGIEPDAEMATALFTAVSTDTGSFRYENTRPHTLRLAADLCARGARPAAIARRVWEDQPLPSLRLLALALATLRVELEGKYAWVEVDRDMLARVGATEEHTERLVDYPRRLRGVEVAALLAADQPGKVRVSLRSTGRVDVSLLAGRFGGGGHARAAGCTLTGDLALARAALIDAVSSAL